MVTIASEAEDKEVQQEMQLRMEDPKLHQLLQQVLTKVKIPAVTKETRFAKMTFIALHTPAGQTLILVWIVILQN
jgi:hypothetical protein